MALPVIFLGVHFLWLVSLTGLLVAILPWQDILPPGVTFFFDGGETDFPSVALQFPPLTGLLLLLGPAILSPLHTFTRF